MAKKQRKMRDYFFVSILINNVQGASVGSRLLCIKNMKFDLISCTAFVKTDKEGENTWRSEPKEEKLNEAKILVVSWGGGK